MSDWDLSVYLRVLRRWWWLLVLAVVLAASASFVGSKAITPTYRASTTLIVGEDSSNPRVKPEDVSTSIRLVGTYASSATRQPTLQAVVQSLGLNRDWQSLQDNVVAVAVQGTQLVELRVTDSDPQMAAAIANEIAHQMIVQSPTMQNLQDLADRRQFAKGQLDALQANIDTANLQLEEKRAALDDEQSARAVMDLKDQVRALETKIGDWRAAYASLAASFPTRGPNTITVLEQATPPVRPVSPNIPANVGLAAAVALLLALAAVFLIEYSDSGKLGRGVGEDAASALGLLPLGSVPRFATEARAPAGPIALIDVSSPAAETCRLIRTNLQFAWGSRDPMALLITSPGVGEGKSTLAANLAVSFAQAGKRTVLVDADLRHPTQHLLFGLPEETGLADLLEGTATGPDEARRRPLGERLADRLLPTSLPNLSVLPAGRVGETPASELLASPETEAVLKELRSEATVVVVDGPPVLPISDATILGALGLGVVLVVEAERTRRDAAEQARARLAPTSARVLGVVLNKVGKSADPYYARYAAGKRSPSPRERVTRVLGGA